MINTDMYLATLLKDGEIHMTDRYSSHNLTPDEDVEIGGTSDITVLSSSSNDQGFYVEFTRPLNTGDEYDEVLYENIVTDFSYAYLETDLTYLYHGTNNGWGTLKMASTQQESYFDEDPRYNGTFEDHGHQMSVAWLIIIPVSISIARYFKGSANWFYAHAILSTAAILITFYSVQTVYEENARPTWSQDSDIRLHSRSGFIIGSLVICQGLLGVASRVFIYFKPTVFIIMVVRRAHKILGYSLSLIALFSVFGGWKIYQESDPTTIIILFIVFCAVIASFLEFKRWFSHVYDWFRPKKFEDEEESFEGKKFIESSHTNIYKKILTKNKQWSFCDEYLLDVSDFMNTHPGGKMMIKKTIGQDLGKYIHGSSSMPPMRPFTHPKTITPDLYKLIIGYVGFETRLLTPVATENYTQMKWRLTKTYNVCESTFCLEVESPNWKIESPLGAQWMGKHFLVANKSGDKRYYSMILCDVEKWIAQIKDKGYSIDREPENSNQNALKLYIKYYEGGKVSSAVTQLSLGSVIEMKGPMGPGLMIDSLPNKTCMAFAGGTGLLPFLDLAYCIWERNIPEKFKLYLYVSYTQYSDIFCLDIFKALEKEFPEVFFLHVNIDKEEPNFMTKELLGAWVDINKVHIAWTCGTSGFSHWVKNMLKAIGFEVKRKLIML